eukprot:364031-Chlamydomonas_euryale.AAC.4
MEDPLGVGTSAQCPTHASALPAAWRVRSSVLKRGGGGRSAPPAAWRMRGFQECVDSGGSRGAAAAQASSPPEPPKTCAMLPTAPPTHTNPASSLVPPPPPKRALRQLRSFSSECPTSSVSAGTSDRKRSRAPASVSVAPASICSVIPE